MGSERNETFINVKGCTFVVSIPHGGLGTSLCPQYQRGEKRSPSHTVGSEQVFVMKELQAQQTVSIPHGGLGTGKNLEGGESHVESPSHTVGSERNIHTKIASRKKDIVAIPHGGLRTFINMDREKLSERFLRSPSHTVGSEQLTRPSGHQTVGCLHPTRWARNT